MADTGNQAPLFVDREVIVVTRSGVWLADGIEISHEPTRKLFARSLLKDEVGYYLSIGRETKRVEVEDTAFFVTRCEGEPRLGYFLTLSNEQQLGLDPQNLLYEPGRLIVKVKVPGIHEPVEARFLHLPYLDLLKDLQEDGEQYFLVISGTRVRLARKPSE